MSQAGFLAVFLLTCCWAPSFAWLKLVGSDIPPITVAASRIAIAALLLNIVAYTKYKKTLSLKAPWGHALVMGFFAAGLPFILFAYAAPKMLSMWGSIFTGFVPMLTALMSHYLLVDEKLNRHKVLGMLLGLVGILNLTLPSFLDAHVGEDSWALLACLGGSLCYAIGMIYSKKHFPVQGLAGANLQISATCFWLVPLALVTEQPWTLAGIPASSVTVLLLLGTISTATAFIVYFWISQHFGASYLGMVGYPLPVMSALIGVVFMSEPISLSFLITLTCVLGGIILMSKRTYRFQAKIIPLNPPPSPTNDDQYEEHKIKAS